MTIIIPCAVPMMNIILVWSDTHNIYLGAQVGWCYISVIHIGECMLIVWGVTCMVRGGSISFPSVVVILSHSWFKNSSYVEYSSEIKYILKGRMFCSVLFIGYIPGGKRWWFRLLAMLFFKNAEASLFVMKNLSLNMSLVSSWSRCLIY